MNIIFGILCVAIGLFIFFLVVKQFYKLGKILKDRYPLIYRLYAIFWSLLGFFLALSLLVGAWSWVNDYTKDKKADEFSRIMSGIDNADVRAAYIIINDRVDEGKYISLSDINKISGLFPEFSKAYKKAMSESGVDEYNAEIKLKQLARIKNPVATKDIENKFYEIGYWQKPIENTAQIIQFTKQQGRNQSPQTSNNKEEVARKKHYYSFDVFISPDLQEKVGSDTYKLQGMIADAKNAQKQDMEIFEMLKETNQYGSIIKEYEDRGLSNVDIAEKFGLSL